MNREISLSEPNLLDIIQQLSQRTHDLNDRVEIPPDILSSMVSKGDEFQFGNTEFQCEDISQPPTGDDWNLPFPMQEFLWDENSNDGIISNNIQLPRELENMGEVSSPLSEADRDYNDSPKMTRSKRALKNSTMDTRMGSFSGLVIELLPENELIIDDIQVATAGRVISPQMSLHLEAENHPRRLSLTMHCASDGTLIPDGLIGDTEKKIAAKDTLVKLKPKVNQVSKVDPKDVNGLYYILGTLDNRPYFHTNAFRIVSRLAEGSSSRKRSHDEQETYKKVLENVYEALKLGDINYARELCASKLKKVKKNHSKK